MGPTHLLEDGQVREAVLGRSEDGPDDDPGRVVDGAGQGELRPAALEPVVGTAVDLDQQPGLGHPLAAAAVPGRPALAGRAEPRPPEQALERRAADDDGLVLGQQFGQVAVVDTAIAGLGELDDATPDRCRQSPG